ncbi:MAG TPA: ATP-binding protein [Stenomitos sp.]
MTALTRTSFQLASYSVLFEQLKAAIVELGRSYVPQGILLTDAHLGETTASLRPFVVIVAPEFRVLLQINSHTDQPTLTFNPQEITAFLKKLKSQVAKQSPLKTQLTQALAIQPADSPQGSPLEHLTQSLFRAALQTLEQAPPQAMPLSCQPLIDAALHQKVKQEQLVNQVTTQIRQSLELPMILQTAVHKVRECLDVDRLLIYQFDPPSEVRTKPQANVVLQRGRITYESCADSSIGLIKQSLETSQWAGNAAVYRQYRDGKPLITAAVRNAGELLDGPAEWLYQSGVCAQLVMPLLVQEQLWGLLIAHRRDPSRTWETSEIEFLDQVTEHLVIAIHQAELYHQLRLQKQTLEDQVNQRTQELRASLVETQAANRAKSEFLATMSHELRTPLTCVIGMSATLIRWSLGPLNDKQRSYLQTIHDSGEHLLELINDILDFSQAEAGKATLNLSEFSLSSLAQQSAQTLRSQAESGEITLRVNLNIPPDRDRFVADSRRVKQVLFSLLSNAIKFTQVGGEVTLRVWVEANSAIFQVQDNGIGIPASQQPLLFQKFQQLDTSYRRVYDGAGLGLALAKQIVDLHQGWIEVNSVEGQGSIFTVELPNQRLVHRHNDELRRSRYTTDLTARIVLLEDHEESATLICEMLTAAGYHVVWLVEDSTALEQIQFIQPAAVIISLDQLNIEPGALQPNPSRSIRLIQRFRQRLETKTLKIIALTPPDFMQDPQFLLAAGADTYLPKPLNPEYLVHKVDMLLANIADPTES